MIYLCRERGHVAQARSGLESYAELLTNHHFELLLNNKRAMLYRPRHDVI